MPNIVVTNSGIEFGLSPLACAREGNTFVIPTSVRSGKQKSAYRPQTAQTLFDRIVERDDVSELNVDYTNRELPPELDQRLDHVCAQYMRQRKREGCSDSDAPKYLDRAKKDILLFNTVSAELDGESIALVSGLTRRYFEAAAIQCVDGATIEQEWPRTDIFTDVKKFDRKDFFVTGCLPALLFFGGPILLIAIIQLGWFLISPAVEAITGFVVDHADVWRVAIFLWLTGLFLYFVRSRLRLYYGVAETFFGVALSYMAFPKDTPEYTLVRWLSFFAALYVMVRGLDNIGKSLRNDTAIRVWAWIFGDNYK